MPPLDLTEAEHLKRLVVDPVIIALRSEMRQTSRPILDELARLKAHSSDTDQRLDHLEQRVGAIEKFKSHIAAVCSLIALVTGIAWRIALDWLRQHLPSSL